MSMLQYPLDEFLAIGYSCSETSTLAMVLEMFDRKQCDRLIVVNQDQRPVGVLYSARLTQQWLFNASNGQSVDLQQTIAKLGKTIVEPIQILPATHCLEQLSALWREQANQNFHSLEWVLVDVEGKFLGLLNVVRLLNVLATNQLATPAAPVSVATAINADSGWLHSPKIRRSRLKQRQTQAYQPLVQLLERLPWPLMLQTGKGQVISQNPAWWQQLGTLKDPEGIRRQVETILAANRLKQPEYANSTTVSASARGYSHQQEHYPPSLTELPALQYNPPVTKSESKTGSDRCFLDSQLGTCTCIVEVQSGQERIWQFSKIPLDSPELKVDHTDSEVMTPKDGLWLVSATDITEQQQLCKELAAKNADLIQLNRLKDEFLACISHELKTPLTAVLGLSRLLVDQQLGELNERQARYAGLIHQSGRHLMSVVNDILDLTRMETGQMELTLAPVDIKAVCDRAVLEATTIHDQSSKGTPKTQKSRTRSSELKFAMSIESGLEQIIADELRLRQMLVHLLSNAFKFTELAGEVGLRVSYWEGWIAFTIWDTGIGIPEHQQHLIFQKFQQLENPLTRQFEGTGLGLVLTRALARLHGGDVSFLSQEGKGSQFTLLLPPIPPNKGFTDGELGTTAASESEATETLPRQQTISSQHLVLVVEAVARYIQDFTDQLKSHGYRVVIARSGTEAVEKARRLQPRVIFVNPLLPLLSGWDVLTLLKSDSATSHIPVIITATGAEKEQAFANRANGFLSLPVESQFLTPLLEKLCTEPTSQQTNLNHQETASLHPLRILRLVAPESASINPYPSLREHRVIEVDDLDQAELLARVWEFDVVLLDIDPSLAPNYLQLLIQHPRLSALPLVTCDVATTLSASQLPGLSVFPCLTPLHPQENHSHQPDPLLSVLQIASGICYPPSILVVDITMLQDLPQARRKPGKGYSKDSSAGTTERGTEWFQALIQYLQTAGFKAMIARCWAEVLQQIRHQSVDLLIICLGAANIPPEVSKILKSLQDLPLNLPPILVIDQRLRRTTGNTRSKVNSAKNSVTSIEQILNAIATQIVPSSISMEELLIQINQSLKKDDRY